MEPTPGRTGVTFEQIAAIADAMTAQGNRPTLRGVRAELGTGSMGTIQKHLTAWQGTRRAIVTSSATLPTEIQRVILGEIERSVSEARAELEADLAATKGALGELADDNEQQAGQIEQQAAQMAEAAAVGQQQIGRIAQLETDLTSAAEEIKREREEAANARQSLAKAELRLEAIPKIEADAERLRVALEAASARATAAEQSAAVGVAQMDGLRAQVDELRQTRGRIEAERDQAREQAHQAQGEAREQTRRIEAMGAEIQALRAQVEELRKEQPRLIDARAQVETVEAPTSFSLEPSPPIQQETIPATQKKAPAKRRSPPPAAA
jgi:colicin import membrane protein